LPVERRFGELRAALYWIACGGFNRLPAAALLDCLRQL
jgi:hypothetical protein